MNKTKEWFKNLIFSNLREKESRARQVAEYTYTSVGLRLGQQDSAFGGRLESKYTAPFTERDIQDGLGRIEAYKQELSRRKEVEELCSQFETLFLPAGWGVRPLGGVPSFGGNSMRYLLGLTFGGDFFNMVVFHYGGQAFVGLFTPENTPYDFHIITDNLPARAVACAQSKTDLLIAMIAMGSPEGSNE